MSEPRMARWRPYFIALVILAELAHLAWEYFNGGVRSHHVLNRADLPEISNAWGLLLLPALAWFLSGRIQKRIALQTRASADASKLPMSVVAGFAGALLFGVVLSASFTYDYDNVASVMFRAMFLLALLLPVYRAECVLGFVLGMTFTFGAVLPTGIGSIFAALSAVAHLLVRPVLIRLWRRLRDMRSTAA
jgi:hypothetical protein